MAVSILVSPVREKVLAARELLKGSVCSWGDFGDAGQSPSPLSPPINEKTQRSGRHCVYSQRKAPCLPQSGRWPSTQPAAPTAPAGRDSRALDVR